MTDIYQLLRNESVTDEQIIDYVVNLCIRLDIFANPDQVCGGTALILLVINSFDVPQQIDQSCECYDNLSVKNSQLSNTLTVAMRSLWETFAECLSKTRIVDCLIQNSWNGPSTSM